MRLAPIFLSDIPCSGREVGFFSILSTLQLSRFYFGSRYNLVSLTLSRTLRALMLRHQSSEGFRLTSKPPLNLPFLWHFQMFPLVPCAVAFLACSSPTAQPTFLPGMFVLVAPGHQSCGIRVIQRNRTSRVSRYTDR